MTFRGGWLLLALLWALTAQAQLSPGKLAKAHQQLEGLTRCTQCHELGKPVDGARCLECHTALKARVQAGKGFHAGKRVKEKACVVCHSDHHGRDFQLIFWEKGDKAFSHSETGWELEGRHAEAKCRTCHRPELLPKAFASRTDLNKTRTYLGLPKDCRACHRDEHQDQLGDDCASCHDARAWDRVRFDHHKARFALTGAHQDLACAACHKAELPRVKEASFVVEKEGGGPAVRYKNLAYSRCTDCHQDPHDGRLGADCATCHTTASFRTRAGDFDHSRTRYPLTGAHRQVACDQCHKGPEPGRGRPAHGDCTPCHIDPHAGQFSGREPRLACSSCHGTGAFKPSDFGLSRHQSSPAPLQGAHLAVGCGDCHKAAAPDQPLRFRLAGRGFSGQTCLDCHEDVHQRSETSGQGCLECHSQDSWPVRAFDHSRTRFALAGKHAEVACAQCHLSTTAPRVPLAGVQTQCAGCHEDPHRGQFELDSQKPAACERCHTPQDWKETSFSHAASRFPLDGKHQNVACVACHPSEEDGKGRFTRYKPLGIRCEDCHGSGREE